MTRVRLSARLRLTVLYSTLFVVFGAALLTLNYRLLERDLPTASSSSSASSVGAPNGAGSGGTPWPTVAPGPATPGGITPLRVGNTSPVGMFVESAVEKYRSKTFRQLLRNSVLTLLVGALLAAGLIWLTARKVLAPLHRIAATARRVSEHNLSERIPLTGPRDELFDMAQTFNSTLDRLEAAFAHERRLVANTSHELRTPVANQRILLEVTLGNPDATPDQLREACQTALTQTERTQAIIDAMLALSGAEHTPYDLRPVRLDDLVLLAMRDAVPDELQLETQLAPVTIDADELYCQLAVGNLLTNAVAHNVDGGWITVVLRSTPDAAELIVTNSSANLTAGQLAELREPFRRAGAARIQSDSGTGLGLAIVDAIASVHGWTLTLSIPEPNAFRAAVSIPRSPLDGR